VLHFEKIITTCPGIGITLEGGFGRFWCAAATQLIGHAARLLYFRYSAFKR